MSNKPELYVLVWEYKDVDTECDWTTLVSNGHPTMEEQEKIITKHVSDFWGDDYTFSNLDIEHYWCNRINVVDGYKVKLEK